MTREIKFRAWDGKNMITPDGIIQPYTWICYCIMVDWFDKIVEEEKLPIMQFTWLYDKNNQPIYESDLLRKNNRIYQVKYHIDSYYCWFVLHDITGKNISHWDYDNVEIIWNVYEHTHLLTDN